jgi:hypothetical protein
LDIGDFVGTFFFEIDQAHEFVIDDRIEDLVVIIQMMISLGLELRRKTREWT